MNNNNLASKIKKERIERSWTQAQLAEASGLSARTIQRIEQNGKCSFETMLSLAATFDIDIKELTKYLVEIDGGKILNILSISPTQKAVIGLISMIPAFYFFISNVLYYEFGFLYVYRVEELFHIIPENFALFNLISPAIFIGGLGLSILINLEAVISFRFKRQKSGLLSAIQFHPHILNLGIIVISLFTLSAMLVYAFVENFMPR